MLIGIGYAKRSIEVYRHTREINLISGTKALYQCYREVQYNAADY